MAQQLPTQAGHPETHLDMAGFNAKLALDRTTLAWIRTTLTMASFGFGLVTFFRSREQALPGAETARLHEGAIHFGVALVVLGIVATLAAGFAHWFMLRRLQQGQVPVVIHWPLSITVAMLFAVMSLVGLWELFR